MQPRTADLLDVSTTAKEQRKPSGERQRWDSYVFWDGCNALYTRLCRIRVATQHIGHLGRWGSGWELVWTHWRARLSGGAQASLYMHPLLPAGLFQCTSPPEAAPSAPAAASPQSRFRYLSQPFQDTQQSEATLFTPVAAHLHQRLGSHVILLVPQEQQQAVQDAVYVRHLTAGGRVE